MGAPNATVGLDETDQRMLEALARNARISLKELAEAGGLSSPSAADRLRRLEKRGIIRPSRWISRRRRSAIPGDRSHPTASPAARCRYHSETAEFIECDKVTGDGASSAAW